MMNQICEYRPPWRAKKRGIHAERVIGTHYACTDRCYGFRCRRRHLLGATLGERMLELRRISVLWWRWNYRMWRERRCRIRFYRLVPYSWRKAIKRTHWHILEVLRGLQMYPEPADPTGPYAEYVKSRQWTTIHTLSGDVVVLRLYVHEIGGR